MLQNETSKNNINSPKYLPEKNDFKKDNKSNIDSKSSVKLNKNYQDTIKEICYKDEEVNEINNVKNEGGVNKNEINLIYEAKSKGNYDIFGVKFIENNIENIEVIINWKHNKPIFRYELEKGDNNITLIVKKN